MAISSTSLPKIKRRLAAGFLAFSVEGVTILAAAAALEALAGVIGTVGGAALGRIARRTFGFWRVRAAAVPWP